MMLHDVLIEHGAVALALRRPGAIRRRPQLHDVRIPVMRIRSEKRRRLHDELCADLAARREPERVALDAVRHRLLFGG
jgi:hypothetical protein